MNSAQTFIRSFIAIELPDPIKSRLEEAINTFRAAGRLPVRWLPVENIHLTLKFLGDVESGQLNKVGDQLKLQTKLRTPFSLNIGGAGAFPSAKHPRVIWVGIDAPPDLSHLAKDMEALGKEFGIAAEDRPFSPHLTIGRVQQHATNDELRALSEVLIKSMVGELGQVWVNQVSLILSDLRPTGAIYTLLMRSPLCK